MSYFEKRLNEALDDIPEVPDEEPVWDIEAYVSDLDERDPELEDFLLSDKSLLSGAIVYSQKFFGREGWPELEEQIAEDPYLAYSYAVLKKGPFPKGEPVISKNSALSYNYAFYALGRRRFPAGEDAISKCPSIAEAYAETIIKGRWPKGEKAIYSNPQTAKVYDDFLKRIGEK